MKGGYVSWLDPGKHEWWQYSWFGNSPVFNNLGPSKHEMNPRTWVNQESASLRLAAGPLIPSDASYCQQEAKGCEVSKVLDKKAQRLRGEIESLVELQSDTEGLA